MINPMTEMTSYNKVILYYSVIKVKEIIIINKKCSTTVTWEADIEVARSPVDSPEETLTLTEPFTPVSATKYSI